MVSEEGGMTGDNGMEVVGCQHTGKGQGTAVMVAVTEIVKAVTLEVINLFYLIFTVIPWDRCLVLSSPFYKWRH